MSGRTSWSSEGFAPFGWLSSDQAETDSDRRATDRCDTSAKAHGAARPGLPCACTPLARIRPAGASATSGFALCKRSFAPDGTVICVRIGVAVKWSVLILLVVLCVATSSDDPRARKRGSRQPPPLRSPLQHDRLGPTRDPALARVWVTAAASYARLHDTAIV